MAGADMSRVAEAARVIETLTGVPPAVPGSNTTGEEKRAEAARVRRFLALPVRLQEGILRYGEHIQKAYKS
jgi:hypothetical protein